MNSLVEFIMDQLHTLTTIKELQMQTEPVRQ